MIVSPTLNFEASSVFKGSSLILEKSEKFNDFFHSANAPSFPSFKTQTTSEIYPSVS